jgi:Fe-S-cluster containining protein
MEHARALGSDPVYCLNLHAEYGCRHAGACCTAGWAIPVEGPSYEVLKVHFGDRFRYQEMFQTGGPLPEGSAAILGMQSNGACVFFESDRGRLCAVHRELGVERLPSACRQFPRVVLHDTRGTLISLSHFCPTAAELLLSSEPPRIVTAPRGLALDGHLEGLDARGTLPPLLRQGMLTDDDGYAAWERRAIETLGRDDLTAAQAIAAIAEATRAVQSWRPGPAALRSVVEREFDVASGTAAHEDLEADERRVRLAMASVPPGLTCPPLVDGFARRWQQASESWAEHDRTVRAYLAARLFGNWVAYYGRGLHAVVEYLRIGLAVLKMEGARQSSRVAEPSPSASTSSAWQTVIPAVQNADLLLVHLSDTRELARQLA